MNIQEAYNIWAEQYDSNQNKTRDLDQKVTSSTLSGYNFDKVLELGCGTGKNTQWLLTKAKEIVGLDFSEEMLKKAREKIQDNRVVFTKADLCENWEVENNFFDLITSSLTLEHIKDFNHIFSQASEKLRPNGLFFICELHPFKQYMGSKAKFEGATGTQELSTYIHNISEYMDEANKQGFTLVKMKEWFDEASDNKLPRLVSFVFKK